MAVGVAAWVNADRRRVTSDDRESVARSSVRLAVFAIRPSAVRGRVVPLVRVHRPVRVLLLIHMSPFDHPSLSLGPRARSVRAVAGQSRAVRRERGGPRRLSARNFPARQAVGQPRISPCSAGRRRHPSRSVTKPLPLWVPRWRFMRTASVNSSCSGFANLSTGRKEVPARRHYGTRTPRSRLLPANWPCRVRHAVSHVMHSLSSKACCPIGTSPIWPPHPWDT